VDEEFDSGGDVCSEDINSTAGSDIGSDSDGDLGGDLASNDGVDLGGNMNVDTGVAMDVDFGDDLNGDAHESINDGMKIDTDAGEGEEIGDDLNADAGEGTDENLDSGISDDVDTNNDLGDSAGDEPTDSVDEKPADDFGDNLDIPENDITKPDSEASEIVSPNDVPDEYGSSFNDRIDQTPINNGEWNVERGNSRWKPNDEAVIRELGDYDVDGIDYHNGFPDFTPVQVFECKLPDNLLDGKDNAQFLEGNLALLDHLKDHPDCVNNFDDSQLAAIARGYNPSGYTWHHDVNAGRMQLVPTSIHNSCGHFGGKNVWGGGTANR